MSAHLLQEAFAKIERDLSLLQSCLNEAIGSQLAGSELDARSVQALSIRFQLLNMVEENTGMMIRRRRAVVDGAAAETGLWGQTLQALVAQGYSANSLRAGLQRFRVEPVLTAHPTEAKRPAVLRLHRELYLQLFELENSTWTPAERATIRRRIVACLERLWRSGEVAHAKPSVLDEFDNVLHYLTRVFPIVLPYLDEHFRDAWIAAGLPPEDLLRPETWPRLRFGNWVGGDRDGHRFVTADVTRGCLRALRKGALGVLHSGLSRLAEELSLSQRLQQPPSELWDAVHALAVEQDAAFPDGRALDEPWHTLADLLARRVAAEITGLEAGAQGTLHARELAELLDTLSQALIAVDAQRLVEQCVMPVRRLLDTFGLHLADLDVRQNSAFHDRAVGQILHAAGVADSDFADWDEQRRRSFLLQELSQERAWRSPRDQLGEEALAVLDCHRVLAGHLRLYGRDGLGALIVSMTRDVSDLLAVVLLAREAGLARWNGSCWQSPLPVVPLLETLEDLQQGPRILDTIFQLPMLGGALPSLAPQHPDRGTQRPTQQVMIGYSDSNKDAGFLAAQWGLYQAQRAISAVGTKYGIDIAFFHGKGGTVSRGAGPTHRFLEALPHGSMQGTLRLTEQGETIAQKYANQGTATYNLELLQAGTLHVGLAHQTISDQRPELEALITRLGASSAKAYSTLLRRPDFLTYWSQATPVDVLEHGVIGSRPVRRTGKRSLEDLRAIPWVFSWTQSRHYLTGWYGFGSALSTLGAADIAALQEALASWPFWRNLVYNLQSSLASVDAELIRAYAALVEDSAVRTAVQGAILDELKRCHQAMDALCGAGWRERRPRLARTVELRDADLRRLHLHQIALLRRWRATVSDQRPAGDPELLAELQQTVNAISAGLRSVG